ncbi:photosystem I P700 apoprotein A2 [Tanacetum coccineum]
MMRSGVAVVLLPPCRLGLGRIRQAQFKDTQFQAQFKAFEALTLSRRRAIYLVATGSATLGSPYGATHRSLRSSESHCSGPIIPMSEVEQLRSRWSRLDPRMSPLSSLGVVTDALLSQDTLPEASSIHIDFGFSAPYFDLPFLRSGIPNKSLTPRIQWDFTPGESFTLPPLIKTIECIALDFCPSPRFLFALSLVVTPDPKHPFSIHREIQSSKSIKRPSWTKIQRDQSCWEIRKEGCRGPELLREVPFDTLRTEAISNEMDSVSAKLNMMPATVTSSALALFWLPLPLVPGHLVHVAIPASRGEYVRWNNFLDVLPHPQGLGPLFTGQWNLYAQNPDSSSHLFGTSQGAGTAILTLLGGFHPQTQSLWLTDMAHHHLAIAFIFLIAGHMYRTNFGIGHSMKDLLDAHIPPGGRLGRGHKGLYDTIQNSIHFQLGLALASLGVITSLVAQHMYSLPAYAFIAQDFTTQAALYTHHQYIAGFIMTGAFAHGAIFFIRDYNPEQNEDNVLARMLEHKEAIISHLSWASLFLGFHTLGLYVHNDVMLAFGTPEKQILIEPIFAQWIQSAHGKTSYGFDILLSSTNGPAFNAGRSIWLPGWLNAINENSNSLFLTIGPGDFLVHHAIALGLHTTTLILVKGALDARGSKLMPDKKDFGYSFPCDGPGRGGTCDISAWDAFYLAVFWMLNTIGWVTFYWHWKHITLWQGNVSQFNESSTYLMGWLRDYLWLNSSQLINGYNPFGMNSLSVWAWMFLFGHLVWATGFMFLISWRGYWQELIETLAWAHERTPLANLIRWRDKPVALSIVQARLVGLAHFSVGYIFTYAAFLIASTSGKFG